MKVVYVHVVHLPPCEHGGVRGGVLVAVEVWVVRRGDAFVGQFDRLPPRFFFVVVIFFVRIIGGSSLGGVAVEAVVVRVVFLPVGIFVFGACVDCIRVVVQHVSLDLVDDRRELGDVHGRSSRRGANFCVRRGGSWARRIFVPAARGHRAVIPVVGFVLRRRIHPRLHLRSQARLRLVGGKGRGGRGLFAVSADEKRLKSRGWERTFGCDSWRVRGAPRRTRARGETPAPPGAATPEEGRRGMPCSLPEVCGARQRDGTRKKRKFTPCRRCSTPSASRQPRNADP